MYVNGYIVSFLYVTIVHILYTVYSVQLYTIFVHVLCT